MTDLYKFTSQTDRIQARIRSLEQGNLRLRRGNYGPITGSFSKISNEFFDSTGNIDTTKAGVKKLGSMPPTANTNGFAYTSTVNSVTWYWDGTNSSKLVILRRSDGTVQVMPSGSITITGLANTTTYYFYPFWSPHNRCNIGWVQGTVGDPKIAFVLADVNDPDVGPAAGIQQGLQDREPLTAGAMTATTGSSGGAGGGGSSTGGGGCVMSGTEIETLGNLSHHLEVIPETNWLKLVTEDGRILNCTRDHPLYDSVIGKVPAEELEVGHSLITNTGERKLVEITPFTRVCSKHKVVMPEGHLFWANGFLSHNTKALK